MLSLGPSVDIHARFLKKGLTLLPMYTGLYRRAAWLDALSSPSRRRRVCRVFPSMPSRFFFDALCVCVCVCVAAARSLIRCSTVALSSRRCRRCCRSDFAWRCRPPARARAPADAMIGTLPCAPACVRSARCRRRHARRASRPTRGGLCRLRRRSAPPVSRYRASRRAISASPPATWASRRATSASPPATWPSFSRRPSPSCWCS